MRYKTKKTIFHHNNGHNGVHKHINMTNIAWILIWNYECLSLRFILNTIALSFCPPLIQVTALNAKIIQIQMLHYTFCRCLLIIVLDKLVIIIVNFFQLIFFFFFRSKLSFSIVICNTVVVIDEYIHTFIINTKNSDKY